MGRHVRLCHARRRVARPSVTSVDPWAGRGRRSVPPIRHDGRFRWVGGRRTVKTSQVPGGRSGAQNTCGRADGRAHLRDDVGARGECSSADSHRASRLSRPCRSVRQPVRDRWLTDRIATNGQRPVAAPPAVCVSDYGGPSRYRGWRGHERPTASANVTMCRTCAVPPASCSSTARIGCCSCVSGSGRVRCPGRTGG